MYSKHLLIWGMFNKRATRGKVSKRVDLCEGQPAFWLDFQTIETFQHEQTVTIVTLEHGFTQTIRECNSAFWLVIYGRIKQDL